MKKEQILEFINNNPTIYLATLEGAEPRVRAMFLYKADETGITFHTGPFKDVYKQIMINPNVQMCFYNPEQNIQIRVRGALKNINDRALKDEIASHPSRQFMQGWKASCATEDDFYNMFTVFRLTGGIANVWSFESNFAPKEDISLS